MTNHDNNNSNKDTHESKSDKESPSLLPPQAAATPPPSTDDTASLLSPWWSEQTATTEETQPTTTEKTSNTNNSSASNNGSSTHKHTILIGLNRNMEHNDDKEISWKEKCYVFANVPKLKYEGKSDRENLEKLFDYSRECTMNLYVTRILLVFVDAENYHDAIREINRVAILSEFTLVLCWSMEEAGRYLETFKAFENMGTDLIREKVENDYLAKVTDCLTNVRSVNKTDVLTLLSTFGSLKRVMEASTEELSVCPGFGEQKVKRLQRVWKQPFLMNKKRKT
ncbi:Putative DNA excision repair protein ERCC-1 [Rhizopus microsporus]|nr:Putative DNA excision repair protein ERCC-1 [Rhizopus microsporus]